MHKQAQKNECFILIKAQPHRSSRYFETVCCAGLGRDGSWYRQYPVPFRILNDAQQFKRWDWIEYEYVRSPDDRRKESQKVIPETLRVRGSVRKQERSIILNTKFRESFAHADSLRESLTLIRPASIDIIATKKSDSEIRVEREKHADLANQMSMFDSTAKPLKICTYSFKARWSDQNGKVHNHECDDWETSAAYNRFEASYDCENALYYLKQKYEEQYFKAGLALAFSTHSRRNVEFGTKNQWLLVGMIRVDEETQGSLL